MTRTTQWLYGWLLLLPAAALLALFTHYPVVATLWHSFLSTPKGARPAVWVGLDNYRQLIDDPIFWQALVNNLWFALGTIPASIALALLMAVWVNGRLAGPRLPAARVLHADGAADDRRGEHLALLLHAGIRPPRKGARRVRRRHAQLARQQEHGARVPHGGHRVEGGRLLHDLLPRGAAVDVAASRRGGGDRGRVALAISSAE